MLHRLIRILRSKNYQLFTRPYELNIIGLRSEETIANQFDDEFHVFFKNDKGKWEYHVFKGTTDPGTYWLKNPMYSQGTAILKEGQYLNAYQLGMHRGQYKALVQRGDLTIIRDYDRDAVLDFANGNEITGSGFGINIHRATKNGTSKTIDKYSAGCQVFSNSEDFDLFIEELCEKHRSLYGNKFTYTLIDFRAVERMKRRIWVGASVTLGVGAVGLLFVKIKRKFNQEEKEENDYREAA